MVYDGLISVHLPSREGSALPTQWPEGVRNLLFTGRYARRYATCTLSTAAVMAGAYRALREVGASSIEVWDDADETFALTVVPEKWGEAPERWAEVLPSSWMEEPCAMRLRARWAADGWGGAIHLRYAPRQVPQWGALLGRVCLAWRPEAHEGDEAVDPLGVENALTGRLRVVRLMNLLRARGEWLSGELARSLREALEDARVDVRHRTVVLAGYAEEPTRYSEYLSGLEEPELLTVAAVSKVAQKIGIWDALRADGVEGRLQRGRFVPVAEVTRAL